MTKTWLVVGLGNPGRSYQRTRHNVGFMVADELVGRAGLRWRKARAVRAEVAATAYSSAGWNLPAADAFQVIFVKPQTFMNNSGDAVRRLIKSNRVGLDHLVVVHDEIDLDDGCLRLKFGGGDNGHNGLKSLRSQLGSGDYYRLRFGVSRPSGSGDPIDWVLAPFPASQAEDLKLSVTEAADAVECLLLEGLEAAQNRFN